jgi:hypothetical protein
MSLLNPLFLLGLLGIALPIWLHRLETHATEREKFSSTMFMEAAKHRIHVQRKLKYLLLMALRILLVLLLALAFTKPIWERPLSAVMANSDTHHVIVLDTSFSMNRGDSFPQALEIARGIIAAMENGDQASIFAAGARVRGLSGLDDNRNRLNEALAGLSPGQGRLDYGAMISSLNGLIERNDANVVIHFISDFQQTGQPVRFADMVPRTINGRPVTMQLERVVSTHQPNWVIESILPGQEEVTVTVRGFHTEAEEKTVTLMVNERQQGQSSQLIAAGGQAFFRFRNLDFEPGDNHLQAILTPNDALPQDDSRFSVMDNAPPSPVLLLTTDPESLAVTYMTAALETGLRPYQVQTTRVSDLDVRILQRYTWVVIDDLGIVNQSLASALQDYLNGGGAVLATLGQRSSGLASLPITGHTQIAGVNPASEGRRAITRLDASHPVLSQASGWTSINIGRVLPLAGQAQDNPLISLNGNIPYLLEQRRGAGRLLLVNDSLDNVGTDLPVHPVFVTFMGEAARYLSNEDVVQRQQVVDSFVRLQQAGQVFDPRGNAMIDLAETARSQDILLAQTGFYRVVTPNGEQLIAVNPDTRESDLSVMDVQFMQNWQSAAAGATQTSAAGTLAAVREEQIDTTEIWRILLILLALSIIAESILSNRHLSFKTGAT